MAAASLEVPVDIEAPVVSRAFLMQRSLQKWKNEICDKLLEAADGSLTDVLFEIYTSDCLSDDENKALMIRYARPVIDVANAGGFDLYQQVTGTTYTRIRTIENLLFNRFVFKTKTLTLVMAWS